MSRVLAPSALVAALLLGWEAACRLLAVRPYLLPPPSAVLAAAAADPGGLARAALATLGQALAALLAAAAFAWPLALLAGASRTAEHALRPVAVTLQVTPVIAVAPLVVIWAGLDHPERAVTVLAAVVAFFPLFSGALTGLKSADPDLERVFDLYGARPLQRLVRLRLPSALPFALEGLKVAVGLSIIGAVVAEFVAGSGRSQGLAWRIADSGQRLRTADMFAALFVLGALAAALHALVERGEAAVLRRWRGR